MNQPHRMTATEEIRKQAQAHQSPSPAPERLEPLQLPEARQNAQNLARARRKSVEELERAAQVRAQSEVEYHEAKAKAMARLRSEGCAITEAQELLKGEVSSALMQREMAVNAVMILQEKLASIDAERATLHRLMEWSQ